MTTNEYLQATKEDGSDYLVRPHVRCADGFKVSVQASKFHYCTPRETLAEAYSKVELGYPNMVEPLIMDYAEDADRPKDTVYGYVPVEVVDKVIEKHGGIINFNEEET